MMKEVKVGGAIMTLVRGDITDQTCDVLVNAANNHFWMGSGVAGALKRRGGQRIEDEAMALGPVEPGNCVITSAGTLPAKHIIHAAVMGQDLHTDENMLAKTLDSLFETAGTLQPESLAIPALGCGVGGMNIHVAAALHIDKAIDFLLKTKSVKNLLFVLFDEHVFNAFSGRLHELFHRS